MTKPGESAPRDLTEKYGTGSDHVGDFPPPSESEWAEINKDAPAAAFPLDKQIIEKNGLDKEPDGDGRDADKEDPAAPDAEAKPDDAPADDPDVALPDGTTMKLSEINALRAGKPDPSTVLQSEAQRIAIEKSNFEREQREFKELQERHRAGIEEILRDPEKYKQLQLEAGVSAEPHPVKDQQKWVNFRYEQYLKAGWKPDEVTRDKLIGDLMQAQTIVNARELESLKSTVESQRREVEDRKHFDSVTQELEGLYAQPEFAHAATPEGRDVVDALLAQADRDGKNVDLRDIVKQAHMFGARLIEKYVGAKKQDVAATQPLLRGGGSHRAPEPKDYGSGYDGFGKIARDRLKTGG